MRNYFIKKQNKIKEIKRNKKAFTLVEVMLYTAILSIFLLSMTSFVNSVIAAQAKNRIILDVERQGEYISSIIYKKIVNAESINYPVLTTNNSLSLNTNDSNLNPTIISITNNKITIKEGTAEPVNLNSGNIIAQNLNFTENSFANSPENISATFTLKVDSVSSKAEFNYDQDFYVDASKRY
ncbi:MAG: prepilin-type N-terminal cleavage/methylation domain-containing protein [Patescibacteria group bacterium]|jgi:type II secretory pathway pseudopilin PulG|nr:prepilin-type N-terminal cleavage/methylation domain-containing protein [Patescibacteria group bacterium]